MEPSQRDCLKNFRDSRNGIQAAHRQWCWVCWSNRFTGGGGNSIYPFPHLRTCERRIGEHFSFHFKHSANLRTANITQTITFALFAVRSSQVRTTPLHSIVYPNNTTPPSDSEQIYTLGLNVSITSSPDGRRAVKPTNRQVV